MANTTQDELYRGFLNLLRSDRFGWEKELQSGDGVLEDLLEKGVLLDKNGERIPGKGGRSEEERKKHIAKNLKDGKAVYLYKKGEEYPREIRYDEKKKHFTVSEPVDQIQLREVKKPHWFKRYYLNLFSLLFRGRSLQSIRDWKHYEHRKEAFENAMAEKRVERRRRFDPILNGTEPGAGAPEKTEQIPLSGVPEQQPEQPAPDELKATVEALHQQLLELREELKKQQELNAALREAMPQKKPAVNTLSENDRPQPPLLDGKEAVGKEEAKKDFFKDVEKPAATAPKKELDTVEKEPAPEDEPELPADEKQPSREHPGEQKTAAVKSGRSANMPGEVVEAGQDPLSKIAAAENEKQTDFYRMMSQLKRQEQGRLSKNAEKNIRTLFDNAEKAKITLEKSCGEGKRFAGGETIKQIIAYNNIKNQIEGGGLSVTVREMLGASNGAQLVTEMAGLADEVKYAANTAHEPSFFRQQFLNPGKLNEITSSSDKKMQGFVAEHFENEKQLQQALKQPEKPITQPIVQPEKSAPKVENPIVTGP